MLSTQKKFLFVHVQKTAGNSISRVLLPYADDKVMLRRTGEDFEFRALKHTSLEKYRKQLDQDLYQSLFKFAVIRNPWDRMVSYLCWQNNTARPLPFVDIIKRHAAPCLRCVCETSNQYGVDVDYLIRFEHLQDEFNIVCDKIGIGRIRLPKINTSRHGHYSTYYDNKLVELVRKYHGCDVEYGNYKFENIAGGPVPGRAS